MNYNEFIEYLKKIPMYGKKSGLDNIRVLLKKLGNTQENLKIIHVAGTNGKGSVCAVVSSILCEEGYNVGTFTSPHLIKYNERIRYNNKVISNKEFVNIGEEVKSKIDEMLLERFNHPTFFEFITAVAFLYFFKKQVDFAVIEVGLGGRLDSTNIIKNPLVSVITSIDIDHTSILGNTIEEIAKEKAGIIKKKCPIVLYFANKRVYNIIEEYSKEKQSQLYAIKDLTILRREMVLNQQIFSIKTRYYEYDNLITSLLGEYQVNNSATALLVIEVLKKIGINISTKSIYDGFKNVYWPGRMEFIERQPSILLDGAHNVEGIKKLTNALAKDFNYDEITLVTGFLKDKYYDKMLNILISCKKINNVIITEVNSKRTVAMNELEKLMVEYDINYYKAVNSKKAMDLAFDMTSENGLICCTGSLYLIGEIKGINFKREE